MGDGRAVLIYDAECPMCRASAMWVMRLALSRGALEILPCRSPLRAARYPQISETACLTAMQLVLPDGRVLAGAQHPRPALVGLHEVAAALGGEPDEVRLAGHGLRQVLADRDGAGRRIDASAMVE